MTESPYKVEIGGIEYFCVLGSDIDRDGMYLELSDAVGVDGAVSVIMEIFYSDKTGAMTVTVFKEAISLGAVEWLIEKAKVRLPPRNPS